MIPEKLKIVMMAGVLGSPFIRLFEKYIFNDWQFLIFLVIIIFCDTAVGFIKHYLKNSISDAGFGKFFKKIIIYGFTLHLCHILTHYQVNGAVNAIFNWVDDMIYAAIMTREAISILQHLGEIKPDLLPSWILKRLKKFDETGDIKNLTNETDHIQTPEIKE